jgi:ring-1,2-phenylacetyl-CoA epoxidase subunit PaaC
VTDDGDVALRERVLALADDELLMGHHHSEWICVAPVLEEDLAFCSIGQDELGHAHALYRWLAGGEEAGIDRRAMRRAADEYRSAWLTERPTPDWAEALVRHWLYDTAEGIRWTALLQAPDDELRGIATLALREEAYHRRHGDVLVERLLSGTDESHRHVADALHTLAPLAAGLFEGDDEGYAAFVPECDALLGRCGVTVAWPPTPPSGQGRAGVRSEHFAALHQRLNTVLDLDPDAAW